MATSDYKQRGHPGILHNNDRRPKIGHFNVGFVWNLWRHKLPLYKGLTTHWGVNVANSTQQPVSFSYISTLALLLLALVFCHLPTYILLLLSIGEFGGLVIVDDSTLQLLFFFYIWLCNLAFTWTCAQMKGQRGCNLYFILLTCAPFHLYFDSAHCLR